MAEKIKVLELFAGSRSIGKVAELLGMETFSVDKFITDGIDFVGDIQDLTKEVIVKKIGQPHVIWASPVCTVWSKSSWYKYWDKCAYKNGKFIANTILQMNPWPWLKKQLKYFHGFRMPIFIWKTRRGC